MARSANQVTCGVAVAGIILFTIGTITFRLPDRAEAAPATVAGGGVTLHSVDVVLPSSDRVYPGGAAAEVINNNCLSCHSAGMVLTQPVLSEGAWRDEVNKMRNAYKAPVAVEDVAAIVAYLAQLKIAK
jgi:mono/diheme cytochrome c family protein